VLKTISPKTVVEYPKPLPSRTVPSSKTSFPNLFAWLDFFVVIVTLVESELI
jgi:hypothetical protein